MKPEKVVESAGAKLGIPDTMDRMNMSLDNAEFDEALHGQVDAFLTKYPAKLTIVKGTQRLIEPDKNGYSSYYIELETKDHTAFIMKVEAQPDQALVKAYVEEQKAQNKEFTEEGVRTYASYTALSKALDKELKAIEPKVVKAIEKAEKPLSNKEEKEKAARQAEYVRLQGELKLRGERQKMKAAYENYKEILALEAEGVQVDSDTHRRGAEAASHGTVGDMDAARKAWDRAERAASRENNIGKATEYSGYVESIDKLYSSTRISIDRKYKGAVKLEPSVMPFDPAQRGAIERAQRELTENQEFVGLLPIGKYTIDGKSFDIPGDGPVLIDSSNKPAAPEVVPEPKETVLSEGAYPHLDSRLLATNDYTGTATVSFSDGSEYVGALKNSIPHGKGFLTLGGEEEDTPVLDFVDGKATWVLADGTKKEIVWNKEKSKFEIRE